MNLLPHEYIHLLYAPNKSKNAPKSDLGVL
jgi:hypothetical protein